MTPQLVRSLIGRALPLSRTCGLSAIIGLGLTLGTLPTQAQTDGSGLPDWLSLTFEQQTRMQAVNGQFRAGIDGDDQALEWRNQLAAEARFDGFSIQAEIADMRTYFGDRDTPLDSFTTNALDILQLNVTFDLNGLFSPEDTGFIKVGRFTMDQGSRRFVARNRFRNTQNAFGGVHAGLKHGDSSLELFYTYPTIRRSEGDLLDNKPKLDKETSDKIFWGGRFDTRLTEENDIFEATVLGLDENRDQPGNQRFDIIGTGVRVYRNPRPSRWHYEAEGMVQFGDAPALTADGPVRDHRAEYLFLNFGYTFAANWQPRLSFIYHYASGDKDPFDDESNSFDHFYGVPRPDYGPTGLWRAFQRFNINAPGLMLDLRPASNIDGYIRILDFSLVEEAQGWSTTRYQHPGGLGEDHVGTQLETRLRWRLFSNKLTLEGGYTLLNGGSYLDRVNKGNSHYYYVQTVLLLSK